MRPYWGFRDKGYLSKKLTGYRIFGEKLRNMGDLDQMKRISSSLKCHSARYSVEKSLIVATAKNGMRNI